MNKSILPITGLVLLVISLAAWKNTSYSHGNVPYAKPATCQEEFVNEMNLMQQAWNKNLEAIVTREIPASRMVDDAFESMRTYRCWMDYLCRAVRYSGTGLPAEISAGFTEKHIGRIPGCAKPEDLVIPGAKLHYLDQCQIGQGATDRLVAAQGNYNQCTQDAERFFGSPLDSDQDVLLQVNTVQNQGSAFVVLEKTLQETQARQKATAVETKLAEILNKMHAMEGQAEAMKILLQKLDALIPCYIQQCT